MDGRTDSSSAERRRTVLEVIQCNEQIGIWRCFIMGSRDVIASEEVRFLSIQYLKHSLRETFLDQQVREEYRRVHGKNIAALCGVITMLGIIRVCHEARRFWFVRPVWW